MRQNLHLYIGDMEVEFNQPPDILYTYQTTELTNPTVIKNSFSKQIVIYGSPINNNIFGQYWNVERLQGTSNGVGAYFNPSKKVPFTLYLNGDIYESGYVKLDEVKIIEGKSVEYNVTLYGGLGQFFYNLSTDWNTGNKRSLADLNYYKWSESTEPLDLSFTINKNTVATAWSGINSDDVYSVINFAPVYAGIPDSIDADKVVMNFNGISDFDSSVTIDNKTYTISNGYALATLPQKLMAEEVRDYRSYLQTPVIRVQSIIDAICRKENNSGLYDNGFDVELDSDFFTTSNPYYYDSWITLPSLNNLEFSTEGGIPTAWTGTYTTSELYDSGGLNKGYVYTFPLESAITEGNTTVKMSFDLGIIVTGNPVDNLYIYGRGGYAVQLYASDSTLQNENVLAGSNINWLTGNNKYDYSDAVSSGQYTPKYNANVTNLIGNFVNIPNSIQYKFTSRLSFTCTLPVGATCFKLMLVKTNASTNTWDRNRVTTREGSNMGEVRDIFQFLPFKSLPYDDKVITIQKLADGSSYSNRYITKEILLGTDFSPCDFLLSYCKQFGLYIYKDRVEDKIYIKTRKNFYHRNNVVDIQDNIDRLNDMTVKPLNIDYGFFALTNSGESSSFYTDYVNKYGKIYGQKIIATGYDFNADTKNLIDSVFKGAVQAKEMSQYFFKPSVNKVHPYMYNGAKYTLYENGISDSGTTEVNVNYINISNTFEPYDNEHPGYDYLSKPQFYDASRKALGTDYVMLFFNGFSDIPASYNWNLTDDIVAMYDLNNNPCWLMTTTTADTNGNTIAIPITKFPRFSRWFEGNKWMIYSWDFGSPRELYVPDMTNNEDGNIYWNYFKTYYEDSYDVNSKIVEAYIINKDFTQDDLRNFYWFDNSTWRLNKVEDYNVTSFDGTKCEFVKVQDVNNYTNEDATSELWMTVTLDRYYLPASGGMVTGYVRTSDNYGWNVEGYGVYPSDSAYTLTVEPEYWGSSGNFYVTAGENTSSAEKIITIYITAGDIGRSVQIVQEGAYLRLIPSAITFASEGGTAQIAVESNISWRVGISGETELTALTITASAISDVPSSGGSINYNNCNYTVMAYYDGGTTEDVTNTATISSNTLAVSASTIGYRHKVGTLTISASYDGYSASTDVDIYQEGYAPTPTVTGVSFSSITWTIDVPASGGTASKENCTYIVTADYNNGNRVDITTLTPSEGLWVDGAKTVSASTNTQRHSVGSLSLDITYFPEFTATTPVFTATTAITAYQEGYIEPEPSYDTPLTFNIISGGTIVWKASSSSYTKEIQYKINDGNWTSITSSRAGTSFNVSTGDKVRFRGNNDTYGGEDTNNSFSGSTAYFELEGNIMSLINSADFATATTLTSAYTFSALFTDCTSLTSAEHLILPATTLTQGCYSGMFFGCESLTTAPELPATTLANNCYAMMFSNCTSLTTAPVLPATSLAAESCYGYMFFGCTRLNYIKCMATSRTGRGCTTDWVTGVASSGTFVKDGNMSGWTRGGSGIPTNWIVEDSYTGTSIMVGSMSGGTIGLGQGCEAVFNGSLSVSGNAVGSLTNSGDFLIVQGGQFGWSNITYDEAKAVEFGYDWGGSYQYVSNCYLSLSITDGTHTASGVLQRGITSTTIDLTPFWTNDTTVHTLIVTISATLN